MTTTDDEVLFAITPAGEAALRREQAVDTLDALRDVLSARVAAAAEAMAEWQKARLAENDAWKCAMAAQRASDEALRDYDAAPRPWDLPA